MNFKPSIILNPKSICIEHEKKNKQKFLKFQLISMFKDVQGYFQTRTHTHTQINYT